VAPTTLSLGVPEVAARNVVYIYQPTATAITITIANIIASSIEVSPRITAPLRILINFALRHTGVDGKSANRNRKSFL
jgi:hypothetical protein